MPKNCALCGLRLHRDGFIHCEGFCGLSFHKKCAEVREESDIALQSDRNLAWRCNSCICVSSSILSLIVKLKNGVADIKSKLDNNDFLRTEPKTRNKNKTNQKVSFIEGTKNTHDSTLIAKSPSKSAPSSSSSSSSSSSTSSSSSASSSSEFQIIPITVPSVLSPNVATEGAPSKDDLSSIATPENNNTSESSSNSIVVLSAATLAETPSFQSSSYVQPIIENAIDLCPWKVQQDKSQPSQRTSKLIGNWTATEGTADFSFSSVLKLKFLHLSRVSTNVTEKNITSFVAHRLELPESVLLCKRLVKSNVDLSTLHFTNFKLGIPEFAFEKAFNPSIWPLGVQIKNFIQRPKSKNGSGANQISTT